MGSRRRPAEQPLQISLLRGINVGGNRRIAMQQLRPVYESIGCRDVATHLQSGNVVLRDERTPDQVSEAAETAIQRDLGLDVRVIGRTAREVAATVAADPWPEADRDARHVVFLSRAPDAGAVAALRDAAAAGEAAELVGRDLHLLLPHGSGRTKLSQGLIERRLRVVATARNWRTVTKLAELTAGDGAVQVSSRR
ncbi:MAG TPA: DUF1697 domain-containing protein [Candidatus Limnocylindrales bacterium]|nr:DUF1697 domain-containing protein [Candidatus Limnocylindrales bacterium]